jgi:DNA-binding PadR family transcriptional regulator
MGGGPSRRAAPRTIYEATEEGVEQFEAWMLEASPTPPLRDELHMKIALCRPVDLPRLIDMVHGQELACMGRLRDLKQRADEDPADPHEWSSLMRTLARDAEVAVWHARIEWLQSARELLEQLHEEPDHTRTRTRASVEGRSRTGHLQVL